MSRQNSREVSSLEVTRNGSEIEINPFGNGTKPFDDVKVLLLKGADGGVIDQQQSDWNQTDNTKVDYIKNKPTLGTASALDVPESGNASTDEVVKGDDTRLTDSRTANGGTADNVGHDLALEVVNSTNLTETDYDGSNTTHIKFVSVVQTIPASNWSSTVDANGFYTNTIEMGSIYALDPNLCPSVSLCGFDADNLPTSAEIAAYYLVDKFYMPSGVYTPSTSQLKAYAKTKPTTTFYIRIKGLRVYQ